MEQLREPTKNVTIADYSDKIQIVCFRNITRNALQLLPPLHFLSLGPFSWSYSFPLTLLLALSATLLSHSLSAFYSNPLPLFPHLFNLSLRFLSFTHYLASPFFPYYPLSAPIFLPQSTPPLSHPQSLSSFPVSPPSFVLSISFSPEPSH